MGKSKRVTVSIDINISQIDHVIEHSLECGNLKRLNEHERVLLLMVAAAAYGIQILGPRAYQAFHTAVREEAIDLVDGTLHAWSERRANAV